MPISAKLRNLNIAPRKVRLVSDLIRGKKVKEALVILRFTVKRSSQPILKLLLSAVANARHNFDLDDNNLYISKITVDEGRKQKRWEPRARGVASEIQKKTSHITLVLDEIQKTARKELRKDKEMMEKPAEEKPIIEGKERSETKPKFKPEIKWQKPRAERGIQKIFRRKAFSK